MQITKKRGGFPPFKNGIVFSFIQLQASKIRDEKETAFSQKSKN